MSEVAPVDFQDIVAWAQSPEGFYVPVPRGQGRRARARPIRLARHQARILRHVFRADATGKFPYDIIVYGATKKSGKSTLEALVGEWFALTQDIPNEIYAVANDKEQVQGRAFKSLLWSIRHSPFARQVRVTEDRVTLPNDSLIQALSSHYASDAGSNHGLVLFDELWAYTTENFFRLYEELTPVPTRLNSCHFIGTYAGFEHQSQLLWELYKRGVGPEEHPDGQGERIEELADLPCWRNGRLFIYWDHEPRMPWQTPEYLESQHKTLRRSAYKRLHENRWVTSEETYIEPTKWDACVDKAHGRVLIDASHVMFGAVDASTKHDSTAVVFVYFDLATKKVVLADHQIWYPTPEDPIDLEATVEAYLRLAAKRFVLGRVRYDPTQMHRSATTLRDAGIPMDEWPQTVPNLMAAGQQLYDLVEHKNLVLYEAADMRGQMLSAVALNKPRGWKIAKEKSTAKIDSIVALAGAAHAAIEYGNYAPGTVDVPTPFSDLVATPGTAAEAEVLAIIRRNLDESRLPFELGGPKPAPPIPIWERAGWAEG